MFDKDAGHCEECVWYNVKDAYIFCEDVRSNGHTTCSRFIWDEDKEDQDEVVVCLTCSREKDPGKCWWCGGEE